MDLILIPIYSIKGAALANTITYSSVFLIYIFIFKRKYSLGPGQLLKLQRNDFTIAIKQFS